MWTQCDATDNAIRRGFAFMEEKQPQDHVMLVDTWQTVPLRLRTNVFLIRESTAARSRFVVISRKISDSRGDPEIHSFKTRAHNCNLKSFAVYNSGHAVGPGGHPTSASHSRVTWTRNLTSGSILFLTCKREIRKMPYTRGCCDS